MDGTEITQLLKAAGEGDAEAPRRLIEAVYTQLHGMAEARMRAERAGHTLQATALVNEAFLRLQQGGAGKLEDRAHFFGAAATAMERVLVDHARRRRAQKRGGDNFRVTLQDLDVQASAAADLDVIDVHDAVGELEKKSEELARLVRYRYFVQLTLEQIAEIEGASLATVKRRWTYARAWLYERLEA